MLSGIKKNRHSYTLITTLAMAGSLALSPMGRSQPLTDPDHEFSLAILSDPQFPRHHRHPPTTGETPWESAGDREDCIDAFDKIQRNPMCPSARTNEAIANAINHISSGLSSWPSIGFARGGGESVTAPAAVIVNGDLTEFYHEEEAELYRQIYTDGISRPIRPGLGNHDDQINNKHENSRDAADWLAALLGGNPRDPTEGALPGVVNHHIEGFVSFENTSARVMRFRVSWKGIDGNSNSNDWKEVPHSGLGIHIIPEGALKVTVDLQYFKMNVSSGEWVSVWSNHRIADPASECFHFDFLAGSPRVRNISCVNGPVVRQMPTRSGSLSYSFDIGKYHFVQLNDHLNYEALLTDQTCPDKLDSPLSPNGVKPDFLLAKARIWLIDDLDAATAAGKPIVINVHDVEGNKKRLCARIW